MKLNRVLAGFLVFVALGLFGAVAFAGGIGGGQRLSVLFSSSGEPIVTELLEVQSKNGEVLELGSDIKLEPGEKVFATYRIKNSARRTGYSMEIGLQPDPYVAEHLQLISITQVLPENALSPLFTKKEKGDGAVYERLLGDLQPGQEVLVQAEIGTPGNISGDFHMELLLQALRIDVVDPTDLPQMTITIDRRNDSPNGWVVIGAPGVTLARYNLRVMGRALRIGCLGFSVNSSSNSIKALRNGAVFVDGVQRGPTKDLAENSFEVASTLYDLGSFLAQPNVTYIVEIRAEIFDSAGVEIRQGEELVVIMESGLCTATDPLSGAVFHVPSADHPGNTLTAVSSGTFTVARDGNSPSTGIVCGNQTVTNAKFKFTSQGIDHTLTELFLKLIPVGSSNVVNKAVLKDGQEELAVLTFGTNVDVDGNSVTDSVNLTGLSVLVPANSSKVLTVDLELLDPSSNFGTSGVQLQLTVDEMTYVNSAGVVTTDASPGIGNTNPAGNTQLVYKAYPLVTANLAGLSGTFVNGSTADFYSWKVKAVCGSIAMKQFKFAVSFTDVNTQDLKIDQFRILKGIEDVTNRVAIRNSIGQSVEATTFAIDETIGALYISWDDDQEMFVSQDEEVTLTLRGVPSGFNSASGSKDSVAFTLVADNEESAGVVRKFIARDATLNTLELGATVGLTTGDVSDFIWSDISSTAHDPDETAAGSGSGDWHDGYLVEQLNLGSKAWSLP